MKYAVIPAVPTEEIRFVDVEETTLELMQKEVGGYIENLSVMPSQNAPGFGMYCNEEGKIELLPPNKRATLIARLGGAVRQPDFIAGDVVVYGGVDHAGEITGLDGRQEAYLGILEILSNA